MKEMPDSESLYIHSFCMGAAMVIDTLFNVTLENGKTKTALAPDRGMMLSLKLIFPVM